MQCSAISIVYFPYLTYFIVLKNKIKYFSTNYKKIILSNILADL
jgi:hypothetical protein